MQIGGGWDRNPLTAEQIDHAERVVQKAVELGFTFFDHADIYCLGKSEQVFGEILNRAPGLRQQIVIQSKCGIRFADDPRPGDPPRYDFSAAHITSSVEGSLRRLGIETLDILLLHRPDPLVEADEVAAAFSALFNAGRAAALNRRIRGKTPGSHAPTSTKRLRRKRFKIEILIDILNAYICDA